MIERREMKLVLGILSVAWLFCPASGRPEKGESVRMRRVTSYSFSRGNTNSPQKPDATADDRGIGPIQSLTLGQINDKLAAEGKETFESNCSVCHDMDQRKMGPPLGNITNKRTPEFIMNLILNTSAMENKDPIAKKLVNEYGMRMPELGLSRQKARAILEYLRLTANERHRANPARIM